MKKLKERYNSNIIKSAIEDLKLYFYSNDIDNIKVLVQTYEMYEYFLYHQIEVYKIDDIEHILKTELIYKTLEFLILDKILRANRYFYNGIFIESAEQYNKRDESKLDEVFEKLAGYPVNIPYPDDEYFLERFLGKIINDFLLLDIKEVYTKYNIERFSYYYQLIVLEEPWELRAEIQYLWDFIKIYNEIIEKKDRRTITEDDYKKLNYYISEIALISKIKHCAIDKDVPPVIGYNDLEDDEEYDDEDYDDDTPF